MGSKVGIFGLFGQVCILILVGKARFEMVRTLVFLDLCLGSVSFWSNMFKVRAVWMGSKGFERVQRLTGQVRTSSKLIIFGFDPNTSSNCWSNCHI